ncbi:MAG: hypothetical protein PVF96_04550 [Candidatus Bathyarchaeota archaeon]|jgi:rubrerythrin
MEEITLNSKSELTKFLKEQIKIEHKIIKSLNQSLENVGNLAVKGVLKGISLDSEKHAHMYTSAFNLLTDVQPALTQQNLDEQRRLVEEHIKLEVELINKISKKIPSVEDKKVRLLLEAILMDERRHHQLLKQVLEILVQGETITEEAWWDFIWKSAPFHGAPGG